MSARYIYPTGLGDPKDLGHAQIGIAGPHERIALLAGQSGHDKSGDLPKAFPDQFTQALANVMTALAYIGSCADDVMRLQILVAEYDSIKREEVGRQLKATWPVLIPAVTLMPVPRLALDGMLVEIEATATLGSGG